MSSTGSASHHIERSEMSRVELLLAESGCVVLLGSRQTGKTALAKLIASKRKSEYVDLALPSDKERLRSPNVFFRNNLDQLVVIDEIQEMPDVFSYLKTQIDEGRLTNNSSRTQYLVLGSASRAISEFASRHLIGRHRQLTLSPLQSHEILRSGRRNSITNHEAPFLGGPTTSTNSRELIIPFVKDESKLERLWLRGGYPQSYFAKSIDASQSWRKAYLGSYFGHDFSKAEIKLDTSSIERFFQEVVLCNGKSRPDDLASSLSLGSGGAKRILGVFEDITFVRQLPPFEKNKLKTLEGRPKIFVRDTGLLHAVLGISSMTSLNAHSSMGLSWEGFVIESLLSIDSGSIRPFHYRFDQKDEIDLVLEFSFNDNERWGIEIKSGIKPKVPDGFIRAANQIACTRRFMIDRGPGRIRPDGIECVPLVKMLTILEEFVSSRQA
jgi:uncharacterized protein